MHENVNSKHLLIEIHCSASTSKKNTHKGTNPQTVQRSSY